MIMRYIYDSGMDSRIITQTNFVEMTVANPESRFKQTIRSGEIGSMSNVGVRVIHGNMEILSKSQGTYYTWEHYLRYV